MKHRIAGSDELPPPECSLRVALLGGLQLEAGGARLSSRDFRRRAWHLVALLALAPGRQLHRDETTEWLWPEREPDAATANLRYTLHLARATLAALPLDPSAILASAGDRLVLGDGIPIWLDVSAFEELAAVAERSDDPASLRAALALYTGDLLPEARYDDWAAARRERLRERATALRLRLAERLLEAGNPQQATVELEQILAHDAANERAGALLMRVLARSGRRQAALRQYQRLRQALHAELAVEPDEETQHLYATILGGQESGSPSARADTAGNLPLALTSLVGRETEIAEVTLLLRQHRIVTLTGPGGVGKTRLAAEVARRGAEHWSDGAWLVELGALHDPALVPVTVAETLGFPGRPGQQPLEALTDGVAGRQMLLLIDNCEHLLDACATLVTWLLQAVPALRILATSREPLRVPGEAPWRVPTLAVAGPREPVEVIAGRDAVRLFVERARLHLPGFVVDERTAPAVAEVCRRLDGIPLAIELAAARIPALGLDQVAARLDDALRILTAGNRSALPRHQSLRAAIDWSYDLLQEPERRLLTRLAVFEGGWRLEMAEQVTSGDGIAAEEVVELLARLVDASLCNVESGARGLRYCLLEPLRQYALERLPPGEAQRLRRRHADAFLALAEAAVPHLRGARQSAWLQRLEEERDNLRSAFNALLEHEPAAALRLAAALGRFWYIRSHLDEGRATLASALAAAPDAGDDLRGTALQHAGILASEAGDQQAAARNLEAALACFRACGDQARLSSTLNSLGVVALYLGDYDRARALLQECVALRRADPSLGPAAYPLGNLGMAEWSLGRLEVAAALFDEVAAVARAEGDNWSLAITLANRARVAWDAGAHREALALFRESLELAAREGDDGAIADALAGIAGSLAKLGDHEMPGQLLATAATLREQAGVPVPPVEERFHERLLAAARQAGAAFDAAWEQGRRLRPNQAVALALEHQPPAPPALTQREREIAARVVEGLTNQQIAARLAISPRTADTHVANLLRKLGAASRSEVAARLAQSDARND